MLTFGLLMGGLLFAIGVVTYIFAPKVGPNPIFGVRVGYAYASREVWDRTNRFGGTLIALVGLLVAISAPILQWLNPGTANGIGMLTALMLAAILGSTVWMFIYARDLAQGTVIAREMAPVRFRWVFLAPVLVTLALLVAVAMYFYPVLPAERLATHFDLYDQPNGWSTRDGFLISFFGMAGLFVLLNAAVVFIATREPIIALGRWGSTWRLDPERGLVYMGLALGSANLILLAALWDIVWFNTRGVHAFPLSLFLWLLVPVIAVFVGLFFLLGRREQQERSITMLNEISITKDERMNAALAHGGILLGVISRGTLGIFLALLIWITQRGKSKFAARQAAQALVYQIVGVLVAVAVWLGWGVVLAGSILVPILFDPRRPETIQPYTMIPAILLIAVPFAVMIGWAIYGIYAAVQVWHGKDFSYPVIGAWFR